MLCQVSKPTQELKTRSCQSTSFPNPSKRSITTNLTQLHGLFNCSGEHHLVVPTVPVAPRGHCCPIGSVLHDIPHLPGAVHKRSCAKAIQLRRVKNDISRITGQHERHSCF
ncbi:hypothetical protein M758_9G076100 [Ceratodon purpureus]|nr:hypothetical protein M758_9G076100 [Ceratodon purpureus]